MTNANEYFKEHTCTEHYYKHWLGFVYTDGVKALCEYCNSYWLIDTVGSYQTDLNIKDEPFQVWTLNKIKENEFEIIATNGNEKIITKQKIPFSDFSFCSCTLWLVSGVLILPSEY